MKGGHVKHNFKKTEEDCLVETNAVIVALNKNFDSKCFRDFLLFNTFS